MDILEKINLIVPEEQNLTEATAYEKFFEKKLKEWGVDSPDELSDKEKKKFFEEIKREWKK